jgi:hypothetical protein
MRISTARSGILLPGSAAGVIYFVIALATGASVAASIVGGVVVAVIAIVIGILFRAAYIRRDRSRHP